MQLASHFLKVFQFLKGNVDLSCPILLGFSGGTDSTVLLDVLIQMRSRLPLDLHVLHVDHKWRKTSTKEALTLREKYQSYPITFHSRAIDEIELKDESNLEDKFREKRYAIFKEVYEEIKAQALLIAHQREDLIETTFKRILEGSSLENLGGMSPIDSLYGMKILRPFLDLPKEEILKYLEKHQLDYIKDETNDHLKYLRPRMRLEVFPFLEKSFGKSIKSSLLRISQDAKDLKEYLEFKTKGYQDAYKSTSFGGILNLTAMASIHHFELAYILKKILKTFQKVPSNEWIENLTSLVLSGKANKKTHLKDLHVEIDRRRVFFIDQPSFFSKNILFEASLVRFGGFCLRLTEDDTQEHSFGMMSLMSQNRGVFEFPLDPFEFKSFNDLRKDQKEKLKKKLQQYEIPQFLWSQFPVIFLSHEELFYPWIPNPLKNTKKVLCTLKREGS